MTSRGGIKWKALKRSRKTRNQARLTCVIRVYPWKEIITNVKIAEKLLCTKWTFPTAKISGVMSTKVLRNSNNLKSRLKLWILKAKFNLLETWIPLKLCPIANRLSQSSKVFLTFSLWNWSSVEVIKAFWLTGSMLFVTTSSQLFRSSKLTMGQSLDCLLTCLGKVRDLSRKEREDHSSLWSQRKVRFRSSKCSKDCVRYFVTPSIWFQLLILPSTTSAIFPTRMWQIST